MINLKVFFFPKVHFPTQVILWDHYTCRPLIHESGMYHCTLICLLLLSLMFPVYISIPYLLLQNCDVLHVHHDNSAACLQHFCAPFVVVVLSFFLISPSVHLTAFLSSPGPGGNLPNTNSYGENFVTLLILVFMAYSISFTCWAHVSPHSSAHGCRCLNHDAIYPFYHAVCLRLFYRYGFELYT